MAINYKTLADYEVATAEEAQSYFMDQAVIKVDTATDLSSLPTEVKTAYILATGIVMARDSAGNWNPLGGVAAVGTTAPSNPQTGQLWVDTSQVLPAPVRWAASTGFNTISATTATAFGTSGSITLPAPAMVHVGAHAWVSTASGGADLRLRVKWSGALSGNSYDHLGGWHGVMYQGGGTSEANYSSLSLSFHIALPAGTTSFQYEAWKGSTSASPNANYTGLAIEPTGWADLYASGVA